MKFGKNICLYPNLARETLRTELDYSGENYEDIPVWVINFEKRNGKILEQFITGNSVNVSDPKNFDEVEAAVRTHYQEICDWITGIQNRDGNPGEVNYETK